MSICSNCYNNCAEITSDKCVKYTGVDIEVLGIKNGDSINYVTAAIAGFLTSTLDASGIKYELDPGNICAIISDNLVDCADITQKDISNAIAAAVCALDSRVTSVETIIDTIESDYTPGTVPGITGNEGTNAVLQAVINHLGTVETDLDALDLNVSTNYVLISDINTYIADYLNSLGGGSTAYKDRMVPFTVVEYYGSLANFDASGAGLGDFAEIYLCNGNNGTPDKRGRVGVGATSGMGGGSYPPETDPLISGNPSYSVYTTTGNNTVTLTESQLPSHTHVATLSTDGDHTHGFGTYPIAVHDGTSGDDNRLTDQNNIGSINITSTTSEGAHTHTVTVNATGGGQSHSNIQPVLACYYIMYIPTT